YRTKLRVCLIQGTVEALNGVHNFIAEKVREMPQNAQKPEPVSILQPQTTVNPDRVKQVREAHNSHSTNYPIHFMLSYTPLPLTISTFHTNTTELKRSTLFAPRPDGFHVKENFNSVHDTGQPPACPADQPTCEADHLGCTVFRQIKDDDQVALSIKVLVTFMAEAAVIINARPLAPVTTDP